MIKQVVFVVALWCAASAFGSEFTKAFSTTKFCTGFFTGLTPLFAIQVLKKSALHHSAHFYPLVAAGGVVSALAFEAIGALSRATNDDKQTKKYGESFLAGFVTDLFGGPATLWAANHLG